jgi:N-formylglutamate deformylase
VAVNTPFAGTIVPMSHYGKDRRVSSIMIEINRGLYLNDFSEEKTSGFAQLCMELDEAIELLRREHELIGI